MATREEKIYEEYLGGKKNLLTIDDYFSFKCKICGECCRNRNDILMNPYDIFRASKYLNITPNEFITKYCDMYIGQTSNIPVVSVRFREVLIGTKQTVCPMLKKEDGLFKCTIQDAKPVVCAIYPLGRAFEIDKETGTQKVSYFVQNTECGKSNNKILIKDWLNNFNLEVSEEASKLFNNFIVELYKIIDLDKFNKDNRIPNEVKNTFYDVLVYRLYSHITWNEDIIKVLSTNLTELKKIVISYVALLYKERIDIRAKGFEIPEEFR